MISQDPDAFAGIVRVDEDDVVALVQFPLDHLLVDEGRCEEIEVDYVKRRKRASTGVGYEYGLIQSRPELLAKSIPIRRELRDREAELFAVERRFVTSFEEGDVTVNAALLMHAVMGDGLH